MMTGNKHLCCEWPTATPAALLTLKIMLVFIGRVVTVITTVIAGGAISSGQMLFWGCTLVLRRKFSASNFWSDCVKHQCTVSQLSYCSHPFSFR